MENNLKELAEQIINAVHEADKVKAIAANDDEPKAGFAGLMQSLEREDGYVSLVRVFAAVAFIVYLAIYATAFIKGGYVLQYFETFSTFVGTVIFATLGSKYLDFRQQINLGRQH